jgi:cytochrome c oxidase subunit 1
MLYVFAWLFLFVFGGMTGVAIATSSLDVHWHDTYFVVAHFHFIMVGGTVSAFLAGLHYWFPKMFGRKYSERWGLFAAAMVFMGFVFTFLPQFLLGNAGMPRRYYTYPERFQWLNVMSTAGATLLGFGLLLTVIYLIVALRGGPRPGANPWRSKGFEWKVASPPGKHNWPASPKVTGTPYDYHTTEESVHG